MAIIFLMFVSVCCEVHTHAAKFSYPEMATYIEKLGEDRKFFHLMYILGSRKFHVSQYALTILVKTSSFESAIAICKCYDSSQPKWHDAVSGLRFHERQSVVKYLKNEMRHADATARSTVYWICQRNSWDDLGDESLVDLIDHEKVIKVGSLDHASPLSRIASKYRRSVGIAKISWQIMISKENNLEPWERAMIPEPNPLDLRPLGPLGPS